MPQLKEKMPENNYPKLEGLADVERRSEGQRIIRDADEKISKSADPKEILGISDQARAEILKLYAGSKHFDRDVSRFEVVLAEITKVKAGVGRILTLLPNIVDRGSQIDWAELKDDGRKEEAIGIFEIAKEKVLDCKKKNLLQGIFSEAEKKWQKLYLSSDSVRGDLDKLKLELGHLIFKRSEEL